LRSNWTLNELHIDWKSGTDSARAAIARALVNNQNITVLTEKARTHPFKESVLDVLPADVIKLIEQATLIADQKAEDASHTLEQTQRLLNEMHLALAAAAQE
jgi:ABC-type thiamine transport system ATPase subunit